jgi:hypothetical protein
MSRRATIVLDATKRMKRMPRMVARAPKLRERYIRARRTKLAYGDGRLLRRRLSVMARRRRIRR